MQFLAFIAIFLLGAGVFFLLAYLLRKRLQKLSLALLGIGTIIGLVLIGLYVVEAGGWEREGLYRQLNYGLSRDTQRDFISRQEDLQETALLLMSLSSTGLRNYLTDYPEERARIAEQLGWMARYVTDEGRFPAWKTRGEWEQQAYFLAHASIVLANYQSVTLDESYAEQWRRASQFLATGITRSRYKHLASRPNDAALRPHDNAAALYALRLYDEYFGDSLAVSASEDWVHYLERELQYDDTTLPCAGFTATNRCRLSPTGDNLAMLNAYSAAARLPIARDFWREFRHYYKETTVQVFANFRLVPGGEEIPEFCDNHVIPLPCGRYQDSYGQYAAALRRDWLTYYQLNNAQLVHDLFNPPNQLWEARPQDQVLGMIDIALRLCATTVR
ncbi:MAG: hypothetical protein KDC54_18480 [Lewinella sp.]|nr:hypothetical protein [Lewinella sp.]